MREVRETPQQGAWFTVPGRDEGAWPCNVKPPPLLISGP